MQPKVTITITRQLAESFREAISKVLEYNIDEFEDYEDKNDDTSVLQGTEEVTEHIARSLDALSLISIYLTNALESEEGKEL